MNNNHGNIYFYIIYRFWDILYHFLYINIYSGIIPSEIECGDVIFGETTETKRTDYYKFKTNNNNASIIFSNCDESEKNTTFDTQLNIFDNKFTSLGTFDNDACPSTLHEQYLFNNYLPNTNYIIGQTGTGNGFEWGKYKLHMICLKPETINCNEIKNDITNINNDKIYYKFNINNPSISEIVFDNCFGTSTFDSQIELYDSELVLFNVNDNDNCGFDYTFGTEILSVTGFEYNTDYIVAITGTGFNDTGFGNFSLKLECILSESPTITPTKNTISPSLTPTNAPLTESPTNTPTISPSINPTNNPSQNTINPTEIPTASPIVRTLNISTSNPTLSPSNDPTNAPTNTPTNTPNISPTLNQTDISSTTAIPTNTPTQSPTMEPTSVPTSNPTDNDTNMPTTAPTNLEYSVINCNDNIFGELKNSNDKQYFQFKTPNNYSEITNIVFNGCDNTTFDSVFTYYDSNLNAIQTNNLNGCGTGFSEINKIDIDGINFKYDNTYYMEISSINNSGVYSLSMTCIYTIECNDNKYGTITPNNEIDYYQFKAPPSVTEIIFSNCNSNTDFDTQFNIYNTPLILFSQDDNDNCNTSYAFGTEILTVTGFDYDLYYIIAQTGSTFFGDSYGNYSLTMNCITGNISTINTNTPTQSPNNITISTVNPTQAPTPVLNAQHIDCGQTILDQTSRNEPTKYYQFTVPNNDIYTAIIFSDCYNYNTSYDAKLILYNTTMNIISEIDNDICINGAEQFRIDINSLNNDSVYIIAQTGIDNSPGKTHGKFGLSMICVKPIMCNDIITSETTQNNPIDYYEFILKPNFNVVTFSNCFNDTNYDTQFSLYLSPLIFYETDDNDNCENTNNIFTEIITIYGILPNQYHIITQEGPGIYDPGYGTYTLSMKCSYSILSESPTNTPTLSPTKSPDITPTTMIDSNDSNENDINNVDSTNTSSSKSFTQILKDYVLLTVIISIVICCCFTLCIYFIFKYLCCNDDAYTRSKSIKSTSRSGGTNKKTGYKSQLEIANQMHYDGVINMTNHNMLFNDGYNYNNNNDDKKYGQTDTFIQFSPVNHISFDDDEKF